MPENLTESEHPVTVLPYPQPDETLPENFRVHPEHAHLSVSDLGRVYSDKAKRLVGYKSGPQGNRPDGRNDYLRVNTGGSPRTAALAALVLETFVGPRPEGHDADHVNHDSMDNRLANLRWRAEAENAADVTR